jgi:hypothetical protein
MGCGSQKKFDQEVDKRVENKENFEVTSLFLV